MKRRAIIAILTALFLALPACRREQVKKAAAVVQRKSTLEGNTVVGVPYFRMSSNLSCTVVQSTDPQERHTTLTLVGTDTETPKVVFAQSGRTSRLEKVFETEHSVTFILLASATGSVDSIVLDKETGKFARSTAGNFAGVYSSASVGYCK